MPNIQNILIFRDSYKNSTLEFAKEIEDILKNIPSYLRDSVPDYALDYVPAENIDIVDSSDVIKDSSILDVKSYDLVFCVGGDGTLLLLSKYIVDKNIPIFGVNFGKVGFIIEFSPDNWLGYYQKYLSNELQIKQKTMLDAKVIRDGVIVFEAVCLNEFTISSNFARLIYLTMLVEGYKIDYRCDFLIICTQTGSTAHNLSAGGPILSPSIDAIIVNPTCSFKSFGYPLVLNPNVQIVLSVINTNRHDVYLTSDGNNYSFLLKNDDTILIAKHKNQLQVVCKDNSFNKIIENKWGALPISGK